ncbi:hypothetical protein D3C86_859450 [compost metagenome]
MCSPPMADCASMAAPPSAAPGRRTRCTSPVAAENCTMPVVALSRRADSSSPFHPYTPMRAAASPGWSMTTARTGWPMRSWPRAAKGSSTGTGIARPVAAGLSLSPSSDTKRTCACGPVP